VFKVSKMIIDCITLIEGVCNYVILASVIVAITLCYLIVS